MDFFTSENIVQFIHACLSYTALTLCIPFLIFDHSSKSEKSLLPPTCDALFHTHPEAVGAFRDVCHLELTGWKPTTRGKWKDKNIYFLGDPADEGGVDLVLALQIQRMRERDFQFTGNAVYTTPSSITTDKSLALSKTITWTWSDKGLLNKTIP